MVRIHELGGLKVIRKRGISVRGRRVNQEGSFIDFIGARFWGVVHNREGELREWGVVVGSVERETKEIEYSFEE